MLQIVVFDYMCSFMFRIVQQCYMYENESEWLYFPERKQILTHEKFIEELV